MQRKSALSRAPLSERYAHLFECIRKIHNPDKGIPQHIKNYTGTRGIEDWRRYNVWSVLAGKSLCDGDPRVLGLMLSGGECPHPNHRGLVAQTLDPDQTKQPQFPYRFQVYDTHGRSGPRTASSLQQRSGETEDEWLIRCLENGQVEQVAKIFRGGGSPGDSVLRLLGKMILGESGPRYLLKYKATQKSQRGGRKVLTKDIEKQSIGSAVWIMMNNNERYEDVVEEVACVAGIGMEAVRKHHAAYKAYRNRLKTPERSPIRD